MKFHVLATLVALTALNSACKKSNAAEHQSAPVGVREAEVFALGEEKLESTLHVPGELVAFERVDLYAKVSSFVQKVHADVGTEVKAGQLLATLEAPELGSQLAEAESKLQAQRALQIAAKANYDRLLETSKTEGAVSQNDLEQAEARATAEQAKLAAARAAHQAVASVSGYLQMRAPFGGVITARNVSPGAYVGPAGRGSEKPLYTLQEFAKLRLVVSVPEANVGYLSEGSAVKFRVRSRPGEVFEATVARLAGALDSKLRAERVEMNVQNEGRRLLPDMVAEVELPMTAASARYVVPKGAVIDSPKGTFVVRVRGEKAEWVTVRLGREIEGKVEVFGALNRGEELVAKANEELRDGSPLSGKARAAP